MLLESILVKFVGNVVSHIIRLLLDHPQIFNLKLDMFICVK